jgi:predicted flavoprotein YhiN
MLITHRGLSGPAILQISSYWDGRSAISLDLLNMPRRLRQRWTAAEDRWEVVPSGTEGFAKAEVTAGGIHPDELSSKTMESREAPGLFFVGEVVDVTGHLGGFNFQWAWASGYAAAQAL